MINPPAFTQNYLQARAGFSVTRRWVHAMRLPVAMGVRMSCPYKQVVSETVLSDSKTFGADNTPLTQQQLQVKSLQDQSKQLKDRAKQVKAQQSVQKAQAKLQRANKTLATDLIN